MITRITRGTLRPDTESRVFDILRTATAAGPAVPGLLDFSISRSQRAQDVELVAITVWTDIPSMAAALGPDWQQPSWLPGLRECVMESSVELLETVVTSVEELADYRPAS